MRFALAIFTFTSAVTFCSSYSFGATKYPPLTTTIKSFVSTVPPILSQIKNDAITERVRAICSVIGRVGIIVYSCLSISLLCETYFIPALELIGAYLSLPTDITGALFTPLGTAGPEVFSSIFGIFYSENEMGTGAIIGSAVFNLLIIPASCAFVALYFRGEKLKINPVVIIRDLTLYIISIIALVLVIHDNKVEFIEALMLIKLFVLSVIFLYYNTKYFDNQTDKTGENSENTPNETTPLLSSQSVEDSDQNIIPSRRVSLRFNPTNEFLSYELIAECDNNNETVIIINETEWKLKELEEETNESCLNNNRFLRTLMAPISLVMTLTIPKPSKKYFAITFIISIAWMALLSYSNISCVQYISDYFCLSDTISGITILAYSTAIPDLITSTLLVKQKGLVDMGICSAISSNRFGILIGLGFPWTVKCVVNWLSHNSYSNNSQLIASNSLPWTSLVLLGTISLLFFNFKFNNWTLNIKFAIFCVLIYFIFVSIAIGFEFIL